MYEFIRWKAVLLKLLLRVVVENYKIEWGNSLVGVVWVDCSQFRRWPQVSTSTFAYFPNCIVFCGLDDVHIPWFRVSWRARWPTRRLNFRGRRRRGSVRACDWLIVIRVADWLTGCRRLLTFASSAGVFTEDGLAQIRARVFYGRWPWLDDRLGGPAQLRPFSNSGTFTHMGNFSRTPVVS